MSTSLSIKAICLTVVLASGLSLPGGAVLAGPPQANSENQRDRGRVTDARPRDSVADTRPTRGADGQRGRAEAGFDTRQRRSDGDGNAQAGGDAVSMMDEASPMIATPMMDESSPMLHDPCEVTPGTNVATQMSGNPDGFQADTNVHSQMGGTPDGFQEERNLTAQIDGITAQIDGFTPCGPQAGQPAR